MKSIATFYRNRPVTWAYVFVTLLVAFVIPVAAIYSQDQANSKEPEQKIPDQAVGLIDTFGLRKVTRDDVLKAARICVGDKFDDTNSSSKIIKRLEAIPGVRKASVTVIYGQLLKDRTLGYVVYLGIEEDDSQKIQFLPAPKDDIKLPDEIVAAYRNWSRGFEESMAAKAMEEDNLQGHALSKEPKFRTTQEALVPLAKQHWDVLVNALHHARDKEQRVIAALVMGYGPDKKRALQELIPAARDPNSSVRNNAIRAMSVILAYAKLRPELAITPPDSFVQALIEMLDSLDWTDRNKATGTLLQLDDDEKVLKALRKKSLPTLVEMSRWQSRHGIMAFELIGRMIGMSHEESRKAWDGPEREAIIERVLKMEKVP